MRTDEGLAEADLDGEERAGAARAPRQLVALRDRLYRGEHLIVAAEYLTEALDYDETDWRQAALVGLAMRHHLAMLERAGRSSLGFTSEQLGDGLCVTLKWPETPAINEVVLSVEFTDGEGRTTKINETFSRAENEGGRLSRSRGTSLASEQAVVLRPLRNATAVEVTAEPGHRIRARGSRLSPELRWSSAGEGARQERSIKFKPAPNAPRSSIDVYREKQGNEGVLELTDVKSVLADIERWKRERFARRLKLVGLVVLISVATTLTVVGSMLLLQRLGVTLPTWLPFVHAPSEEIDLVILGHWERALLLDGCREAVASRGAVPQECIG